MREDTHKGAMAVWSCTRIGSVVAMPTGRAQSAFVAQCVGVDAAVKRMDGEARSSQWSVWVGEKGIFTRFQRQL